MSGKITLFFVVTALAIVALSFVQDPQQNRVEKAMKDALPNGAAVMFDIYDGIVTAVWSGEEFSTARPMGSILKVFTTYALLADGACASEIHECEASTPDDPATESCWYRPGHGNMTLKAALVNSCNAYFRQWLMEKNLSAVKTFYQKSGLGLWLDGLEINQAEQTRAFLGFSAEIRPRPLNLVAAAAALFNGGVLFEVKRPERGVAGRPLRQTRIDNKAMEFLKSALLESGFSGTGSALGRAAGLEGALVKTGTSAQWKLGTDGSGYSNELETDGWGLVIYPARKPQVVLLTSAPSSTGAQRAADGAAKILSQYMAATEL